MGRTRQEHGTRRQRLYMRQDFRERLFLLNHSGELNAEQECTASAGIVEKQPRERDGRKASVRAGRLTINGRTPYSPDLWVRWLSGRKQRFAKAS